MTPTPAAVQRAKPSIAPCSPDGPCQHYDAVIKKGAPRIVYCEAPQAYVAHCRERQSRDERLGLRTQRLRLCVAHARAFCERWGLALP